MSTPPKEQSAPSPSTGAVSTPDNWPSPKQFQGMVTLVVGKCENVHTVHKDLLCFYSDYFRAAFNGSFKEATEQKIKLPNVEPEVFETFQVWLYTRRFHLPEENGEAYSMLAELWIFGDQHQMPLLQNETMDEMLFRFNRDVFFTTHAVKLAYENTMAGSHLRKAVIEIVGYTMDLGKSPQNALEALGDWTVESLADLTRELYKSRAKMSTLPHKYELPKRDKCYFHVHSKGEQCPA
ncbi:hypothetical protein M438DRAFT_308161 [Aureobasidium pullulans EXF-150]|uniref:BTB domain-containing protein n=1 Tax=Aureobasidium pullulans EXF-150 TaxID=1043002 RepID=A0A074WYN1_AURPU|nr:uncharacterized protein M438DRAFT_308161 [Aureobasidium pullulans EXF-150]KEQ78320.1 hypothetical protein M438DRAFT_308161 [Aureobasidium pullulans EXF-150]